MLNKKKLKKAVNILPLHLGFLTEVYISGLLIFSVLRLIFLLFNNPGDISIFESITLKSFLIGINFDTVVMGYLLALPLLLLYIQSAFKVNNLLLPGLISFFITLTIPVSVFIAIADIPYFNFFGNRLSEAALQWMGSPATVFDMIISNKTNLLFFVCGITGFLTLTFFYWRLSVNRLMNHNWSTELKRFSVPAVTAVFLIAGGLCFMAIRGKTTHPIRSGDAFYCNHPVLNQAGLNPVFTLMKSFSNRVRLMHEEEAVHLAASYLYAGNQPNGFSPLIREIKNEVEPKKLNVVLVLMEGMSAAFMDVYGNKRGLTPNLDSLALQSLFFPNAYSAGIHTNNGVFSTLYSFPALKRIRPMSTVPVRKFTGLPYALKENGYYNLFFCSHNEKFDNIGNFIPANHFDELLTQEDFPADKSIGPYGVPDDFLFDEIISKVNSTSTPRPFFATVLTASNHDPYMLPSYFDSAIKDKEARAISYADWSIGRFINKAKEQDWFDSTIFIFIADHGRISGPSPYDLHLSFSHVPLLIYGKALTGNPVVYDNFIGQIDLLPTLMGLMNISYTDYAMGLDVLKYPRPAIYFSQDDKIGCINSEWLYIYRFGGSEGLYRYKLGDPLNFAQQYPDTLKFFRNYALSQTQTAESVISSGRTAP